MKRLDILQLWGTRLIQINSDQQLAYIQLVPFSLPFDFFPMLILPSSILTPPSHCLSYPKEKTCP